MKKLHILIIKSYIGPFIATFFVVLFILLMQFVWKYIDDLVGKGLDLYTIAQLLFYAASTFVPLALPLAILLSSLMTFGNLGENFELVAAKAAGISLRKVMTPLIFMSIIISGIAFYFSNNILPLANLKMGSLLFDVREQKPTLNIKQGVFYKGIDNYVIRIGEKDKNGKDIKEVMIYDHTDRMGNTNLTIAKSGKMEVTPDKRYLIFTLYNGCNYHEDIKNRKRNNTYPFQKIKFKEEQLRFDLSGFNLTRTNEDFFKSNYKMLNLKQLQTAEDSLTLNYNEKRESFVSDIVNKLHYYSMIDTNKYANIDTIASLKNDFFSDFTKKEKINIVETAINIARNTNDYIFFRRESFEIGTKFIIKHQIEWHRKFALSFACFVLFFIGAPLGAIIRKGGMGIPLVVSVLIFVVFHIMSIIGEKFAREQVLTPFQGMWVASFIMLPIGIMLTMKAITDSSILDADSWNKFFYKIFKRK